MLGLVQRDDQNMLDEERLLESVSVELYYARTGLPRTLAHLRQWHTCVMHRSLNPQPRQHPQDGAT
jgi:hypothetical protein